MSSSCVARGIVALRIVTVDAAGDGFRRGLERGAGAGLLVATAVELLVGNASSRELASATEEIRLVLETAMPSVLQEIAGMSAATGASETQLLALSAVADLSGRLPGWCSLASREGGDGWRQLGKNLDTNESLAAVQVLERIQPHAGHAFVHLTTAGSCWTEGGVNEGGLALVNASIAASATNRAGLPDGIVARAVLERCRTLAEAVQFLSEHPFRTFGENILVAADDGVAIIEKLPVGQAVRLGAHLATNHPCDAELRAWSAVDDPLLENSRRRLQRLIALSPTPIDADIAGLLASPGVLQDGRDGLVTIATLVVDRAGTVTVVGHPDGAEATAALP
jgi:predicted choloylglycine hydrolase